MAIPCWRQSPPLLTFEAPTAAVILPKSQAMDRLLNVQGQQVAGNLPVYVKIVFVPRRRKVSIADCVDQVAQPLSPLSIYRVSPDDIIVYDGVQSYEQDQDYTIDLTNGQNNIVPRATMAGKTVNVQVTEYFPGYQCSINNMDWSPAVMFDVDTPFPDVRANYFPIKISADGWFPVVDELGAPLGIQIQPVPGHMTYEALLRIEVVADASFGVTGTLEIEFERPGYYNSLRLTPFVNMPISLTQIRAEGMYTLRTTPPNFEGDMLIDRPVSIRFAGTDAAGKPIPIYVRRLYLDFYQPNYELKEHLINPADQARQDALASLQTALPFSDRAIEGAVPISLVGAQYEMGLRDIAGERYNPAGSAVFVSGPFHVDGMPEIIRLDADITGSVDCYLICRPAGIPVTTDRVVQQFVSGMAISFPDVWTAGPLTGADFYLKWVFRSGDAVLTRFLLQVTQGV